MEDDIVLKRITVPSDIDKLKMPVFIVRNNLVCGIPEIYRNVWGVFLKYR